MLDARNVLADALNMQAEDVPEEASMDDVPEWDSLGHMRVVLLLEEIIGRSLNTEEILSLDSVQSFQHILDESLTVASQVGEGS